MITLPKGLTATRLRLILSGGLILTILAGVGIFYLAYSQLSKIATETGEQAATAKQSETTIQRLESIQKELESKETIIARASEVTANSQDFLYQNRLVQDLTSYAARANLVIKSISFKEQSPAVGAVSGEENQPTPPASGAPAGLKKAMVDVTLESPVDYNSLLNFLHYVEQNLTKLKVSRVSMTKSEGNKVAVDTLNLEVYLK